MGWWPALRARGPRSESCVLTTRRAGSGLEPIVDGLERLLVQLGYGVLHVVHSERKFQSHPTVPPGRLIDHIYKIFQPEQVSDYRCNCCGRHSSTEHPAVRQRFLRSLPRFLKISITAPLTSEALPPDYHRHGPLRDYEMLDLSQLIPQPPRRTLLTGCNNV